MSYTFRKYLAVLLICLAAIPVLAGCGQRNATPPESPAEDRPSAEAVPSPAVADSSQMAPVEEVVEEGMVPVYAESLLEGDYPVQVESSSSMFRIESALLHVKEGGMSVTLTMGGKGYLYVYPGSAAEAAAGEERTRIAVQENGEGDHTFTIPVEALDQGIPCAAFSKKKELWYDRTLLLRADSLPAEAFREGFLVTAESLGLGDGEYTVAVALSGGSGRARVASPAALSVKDGNAQVRIVWSSGNYDYMKVSGERILPLENSEPSTFLIPVACFDRPMPVIADTVAMSEPHEISYTLRLDSESIKEAGRADHMDLHYAEHFAVDYLPGGAAKLTVGGKEVFLLLPADAEVPAGLENTPRITIPADNIYLGSSSAADLFLQAGALDRVRYTGTAAENWKIPALRQAVESEEILYAGKYSAPDYELLLAEGCGLALENTMILHEPAVKEKLEQLGIPVLTEYSSYEAHPLGRVEWIRLYGLLSGHDAEAEAFFAGQEALFQEVEDLTRDGGEGKTAAFFHISPNGGVVVRRQADYVTRMIELAGGRSALTELPESENALSSVTIQMEAFYAQARDADVLIYNSTTAGDVRDMEQFLSLSPLLKDFKAVQEGEVWCTDMSMFQCSSAAAGIIADLRAILSGEADEGRLHYLHRIA